jgi:hypothetical protein
LRFLRVGGVPGQFHHYTIVFLGRSIGLGFVHDLGSQARESTIDLFDDGSGVIAVAFPPMILFAPAEFEVFEGGSVGCIFGFENAGLGHGTA